MASRKKKSPAGAARDEFANDAERSKADILAVATEEFATYGLSGARVDAIAKRTRTSKRMIYYYFKGKEGLYRAVLEKAYSEIRSIDSQEGIEDAEPVEPVKIEPVKPDAALLTVDQAAAYLTVTDELLTAFA